MRNQLAIGIVLTLCFSSGIATAQDYTDVVRFSRPDDIGSARFMSMGGAFSALGNDFGATSINPAGVAVYRHSEISLSTYYRNTSVENTFNGETQRANDGQLRFNQLGIVVPSRIDEKSQLSFGIRYHRTNDYGFEHRVDGRSNGTIVDMWHDNAEYFSPNSSDLYGAGLVYEQLAADVGLLEFNTITGWQQNAFGSDVRQRQSYSSSGGRGIFGFDLGFSFNDRWHIGGALEVPTLNYSTEEVYSESNYDNGSGITSMTWTNQYTARATGFQMKIGAIFTPEEFGRFSLYFHSPTYWGMEQTGETMIEASGPSTQLPSSFLPFNDYFWRLKTSMKAGAGYAYVFGKNGLISVDYSFQDLTGSDAYHRYNVGELDYINEDVQSELQAWHDIRVGGEWRLDKIFLRAGYHMTTSPFKSASPTSSQYSGGIGYKENRWGVDFAYSLRRRSNEFYLYSPAYTQVINREMNDHFFITTLYFRI